MLVCVSAGWHMAYAEVAPSLLQNLHWRSIGPYRGGRVLAVEGAPDDRRRFYFGSVNGGVWRTDDAGPHLGADLRCGARRFDRRARGGAVGAE